MKLMLSLIVGLIGISMSNRVVLKSSVEAVMQQRLRTLTSYQNDESSKSSPNKKHLYRNANNDQVNKGTKLCDTNYKPLYYNVVNELPPDYVDGLQVQDYDSCPFIFQKPLYMNLYNFGELDEIISTLVQDWDSVSCELELVKPIYYYRWNDLYVFYGSDELVLPKVEDPEECGFQMPQKELYYNDWNDEYSFKDGTLQLPMTKNPDACDITTIKKNFYYNKWNDNYEFTEKKITGQVQKLDPSDSKCEISEMIKPIYKNTKNNGNTEDEQEKEKRSYIIDDPYDIEFPDPFKEKVKDDDEDDKKKKKEEEEEDPNKKKEEEEEQDPNKKEEEKDPKPPQNDDKSEKKLFMNYRQEISPSDLDDQDHTQGKTSLYSFIQKSMTVGLKQLHGSIQSNSDRNILKTKEKLDESYNKFKQIDFDSKIEELTK